MPSTAVRRGLYWSAASKTWHFEFRQGGRKFNGDTGQPRESDAREWLRLKKSTLRGAEVGLAPQLATTLRQGLAAWIAAHDGVVTPGHLANVRRAVELHAAHLLDTPLDQLTAGDLEAARGAYMRGTGEGHAGAVLPHSEGGANKLVHHLRMVLAWCRARGLSARPVPDLPRLEAQEKPAAVVWPEQVQAFLAEARRGGRDHASPEPRQAELHSVVAIALQLGLGLREGEALAAEWPWVDTRRRVFVVGRSKSRRVREVPIPAWLVDLLESLRRSQGGPRSGLILPAGLDQDGRQVPHERRFTAKPVARVAAVLGIHGLTPHRLRATFATAHFEVGTPLSQVQLMLGHADPATTLGYIVQRPKDQAEAQDRVAAAMGFGPPAVPSSSRRKRAKPRRC